MVYREIFVKKIILAWQKIAPGMPDVCWNPK